MKDLICVFPDTNIFLHYPPINQIDWVTICDSNAVKLVVCLTVIHELDAKKSDSRLSDRAERAIKEIREAVNSKIDIRKNVSVLVFNSEIRASDFPDTLSPDSSDDRIVHLAKVYEGENPTTGVAIATGDYGMELRAEAAGVAAIPLDNSLRLPNPQDELSKKYKQTINELNSLKNRLPKLSLGLSLPDGQMTRPHGVVFEMSKSWEPLNIDAEMERIQTAHPKPAQTAKTVGTGLVARLVSPERWQRYYQELDEFYLACRSHFELIDTIAEARARSFEFALWLANDGNGLASDVDVTLRFPANVPFLAEKGTEDAEPFEKEFKSPKPPKRPNLSFDSVGQNFIPIQSISHLTNLPLAQNSPSDDWTPNASVKSADDDLMEIHVRVAKIKHGHNVCLGEFIALFGPDETIKPFKADYEISTSELVNKCDGTISFMAQRTERA